MNKPIAENKKARFDYNITETLEAGIVLLGSEVKSLRLGKASIRESYACLLYTSPSPRDP